MSSSSPASNALPVAGNASPSDGSVATHLRHAFDQHFGNGASPHSTDGKRIIVARAPGRVNLLGGHTDYSDGFVLPATIDRTVRVALRARSGETVRLHSLHFEERVEYTASGSMEMDTLPDWARYVAGVAAELGRCGHPVDGFDAVVQGDVPLGAGLSSSAALEVAVAVGLGELFSLGLGAVETARLCQRAEQEHVGVECGILDQFAARLGRSGKALFLDCRSLDHRHVALPFEDACLVVADSGVSRKLASSKYNERRRECEKAARFFRQFAGDSVRSLRDVPEELLEECGPELAERLGETLLRRARHVTSENRRVEQGAELLAKGRLEAFGRLMNASHQSLASDYEVSCAELDCLAQAAQQTEGVFGARMTGAGFGGSIVALARRRAVPPLKRRVQRRYAERFQRREPDLYVIKRNLEAGVL